jgi:hypothetical protein
MVEECSDSQNRSLTGAKVPEEVSAHDAKSAYASGRLRQRVASPSGDFQWSAVIERSKYPYPEITLT